MSTFAVFGMTRFVAIAEAKKRVKTTRPGAPGGGKAIQLTPAEWEEAVQKYADKLMGGGRSRQLSSLFDTPQFAASFIDLLKKHDQCRDLMIRCRCALVDERGATILNPKTRMPKIGWSDYPRCT